VGLAVNLTPHAVAELPVRGPDGDPLYVVIVKATFSFADPGALAPIEPVPIVKADEYADDPAASGIICPGDIGLPKPRVDVVLTGSFRFRAPTGEALVRLEVGQRVNKEMRVFGDRFWLPGLTYGLTASRPRPMTELPIEWERSSGGAAPKESEPADRQNPAGRPGGLAARDLKGKPLPNFESRKEPITSWKTRPAPQGFGAIAPHWAPRADLAGTYDDRWRERRAPLLPKDFDPAFLNFAPPDQQLPAYTPGEQVRLTGMTPHQRIAFSLPELSVPIMFVTRDVLENTTARVDTIIIEPAVERVSLIARATCSPRPNALAIREIFVGQLTPGRRRALALGKLYVDLRPRPKK
jgi:hypothetical protein